MTPSRMTPSHPRGVPLATFVPNAHIATQRLRPAGEAKTRRNVLLAPIESYFVARFSGRRIVCAAFFSRALMLGPGRSSLAIEPLAARKKSIKPLDASADLGSNQLIGQFGPTFPERF